ncbi:MAG: DUF6088 family protein [Anaerostipes sp.]|jgi:hypothetical protein|nr:DUF6088 family protein [Anaerostipes sp.]MDD3747394.1 DUF6088 family protein [Anaerostipes sp.]
MTDVAIRQVLTRLTKQGILERCAQGVYYIPTSTPFGKSKINVKKVYEKKYITNGEEIYGYYTGLSFENMIGFTTQMPNVVEIVTNNEKSRVREVIISSQKVRIRKPRVKITNENAKTLQLLDFLSKITWNKLDKNQRKTVIDYVRNQQIKKERLFDYIGTYPAKTSKNLLESRLTDELR